MNFLKRSVSRKRGNEDEDEGGETGKAPVNLATVDRKVLENMYTSYKKESKYLQMTKGEAERAERQGGEAERASGGEGPAEGGPGAADQDPGGGARRRGERRHGAGGRRAVTSGTRRTETECSSSFRTYSTA
jgi:hypothetical protein